MRPTRARLLSLLVLLSACGCSSSASTTGDGGAPARPDAGGACLSVDARTTCDGLSGCDFFLHCGCAGEAKCTVTTAGLGCAAAGAKAPGAACTSDAECARGSICVPFFGVTQCMQFCDRAHACPSGQACYVNVADGLEPPTQVGEVCGPTCSMLEQTCNATGTGCFLSDKHCSPGEDGSEEGLCLASGGAGQGTACTRMGDCKKGYLCIDPAGPSTPMCAKICDRKDGLPSCELGTCRELPGHTQTGICLP